MSPVRTWPNGLLDWTLPGLALALARHLAWRLYSHTFAMHCDLSVSVSDSTLNLVLDAKLSQKPVNLTAPALGGSLYCKLMGKAQEIGDKHEAMPTTTRDRLTEG